MAKIILLQLLHVVTQFFCMILLVCVVLLLLSIMLIPVGMLHNPYLLLMLGLLCMVFYTFMRQIGFCLSQTMSLVQWDFEYSWMEAFASMLAHEFVSHGAMFESGPSGFTITTQVDMRSIPVADERIPPIITMRKDGALREMYFSNGQYRLQGRYFEGKNQSTVVFYFLPFELYSLREMRTILRDLASALFTKPWYFEK